MTIVKALFTQVFISIMLSIVTQHVRDFKILFYLVYSKQDPRFTQGRELMSEVVIKA